MASSCLQTDLPVDWGHFDFLWGLRKWDLGKTEVLFSILEEGGWCILDLRIGYMFRLSFIVRVSEVVGSGWWNEWSSSVSRSSVNV